MNYIDTHAHIDGPEFEADRQETISRAQAAGAEAILVPAIDLPSSRNIMELCSHHKGFLYPMVGLHPEEVKADYAVQIAQLKALLAQPAELQDGDKGAKPVAIGEVGLDFYWSREFENEQMAAFEAQVEWAIEQQLPLMIHCRKAQNEMVRLLRRYEHDLVGGVFHCFTGNSIEAAELLQFSHFVLGIGGVLTFKKSHLPEVLPAAVPLDRIVLETDAPYMAPVPMRGKRNESAYVPYVIQRLAEAYAIAPDEVARQTTATARRLFKLA